MNFVHFQTNTLSRENPPLPLYISSTRSKALPCAVFLAIIWSAYLLPSTSSKSKISGRNQAFTQTLALAALLKDRVQPGSRNSPPSPLGVCLCTHGHVCV